MNTDTQTLPSWSAIHSRVVSLAQSLAPGIALDGVSPEVAHALFDAADKLQEAILRAHGVRVRKPQSRNAARMAEVRAVVVSLLHEEGPEAYNLLTDAEVIQIIQKRTGKTTTRQTLAKCDYHHHARQLKGSRRDRKLYTQSVESVL